MKIALNYDPKTGQVTDNMGTMLVSWAGLETHEVKDDGADIEALVKLKNAGFNTDDIVELRRKEII